MKKENINIISTGSIGNAVVINNNILIDCGVSYAKLKEVVRTLQVVLLTHIHIDHFLPSTIKLLAENRPTLRFVCGDWLVEDLIKCGVNKKNIDVINQFNGVLYSNGLKVNMQPTYHNVPNCCYKIILPNKRRIFYATDTYTLDNVSAKEYDYYLIEANYGEEEIEERINAKKTLGMFIYELKAKENHLSQEKADEWLNNNMGYNSEIIYLHGHIDKGQ